MVKSKISGNILRFSFHFFVGLKLVVSESINFATGDNNMQLDATNSNVSEKCVLCKSTNTPATTVDEMEPNNISRLYEGTSGVLGAQASRPAILESSIGVRSVFSDLASLWWIRA